MLVVLSELAPQRDVPYVVFPVLLWAALRLGPRGAATAIVVVCGITVWNTAEESGPFVRDSITDSLLATQVFIATASLTSLVQLQVGGAIGLAVLATLATTRTEHLLNGGHGSASALTGGYHLAGAGRLKTPEPAYSEAG